MQGAEELPESYKAEFEEEFGIPKGGKVKKTKRQSAASKSKPDVEKPAPKKRKSGVKGKAEPKDDEVFISKHCFWQDHPREYLEYLIVSKLCPGQLLILNWEAELVELPTGPTKSHTLIQFQMAHISGHW